MLFKRYMWGPRHGCKLLSSLQSFRSGTVIVYPTMFLYPQKTTLLNYSQKKVYFSLFLFLVSNYKLDLLQHILKLELVSIKGYFLFL